MADESLRLVRFNRGKVHVAQADAGSWVRPACRGNQRMWWSLSSVVGAFDYSRITCKTCLRMFKVEATEPRSPQACLETIRSALHDLGDNPEGMEYVRAHLFDGTKWEIIDAKELRDLRKKALFPFGTHLSPRPGERP